MNAYFFVRFICFNVFFSLILSSLWFFFGVFLLKIAFYVYTYISWAHSLARDVAWHEIGDSCFFFSLRFCLLYARMQSKIGNDKYIDLAENFTRSNPAINYNYN